MDNRFVLWILLAIFGISIAENTSQSVSTAGPVIPAYPQPGYIQHTSYPYSESFESPSYGSADIQNGEPPSRSVVCKQ